MITILTNIKAAIFDLDGTLVDSLWVWQQIDTKFLKKHGYISPANLITEICHLSFIDTAKYFKERFNISDSIEDIMAEWNSMAFDEYSNNVFLKEGAKDFLDKLRLNNIKIGLATSNSPLLLEVVLKNNGIYEYFDTITTTSEVTRGKDHPDVYLLSSQKMNVDPSECIVFEDILAAVKGAKKANMKVYAIKDIHSASEEDTIRNTCDTYIESFLELL